MNVSITIYDGSKYNRFSKAVAEKIYKNIKGFHVMTLEDKELFRRGYTETDENKEYLFITLENDSIATFRNSRVDLFRL